MDNIPIQGILGFYDSTPVYGLNFDLLGETLSLQCILCSPSEPYGKVFLSSLNPAGSMLISVAAWSLWPLALCEAVLKTHLPSLCAGIQSFFKIGSPPHPDQQPEESNQGEYPRLLVLPC